MITDETEPAQETCFLNPKAPDYKGNRSVTNDGKSCLKWADHSKQIYFHKALPECLSGLLFNFIFFCVNIDTTFYFSFQAGPRKEKTKAVYPPEAQDAIDTESTFFASRIEQPLQKSG